MSNQAPNITDLACDLRNAGWTDADTRYRGTQAVCEWTRGGNRAWALIDCTTNVVIRHSANITHKTGL